MWYQPQISQCSITCQYQSIKVCELNPVLYIAIACYNPQNYAHKL